MSNVQGLIDKYMSDGAERFFHDIVAGNEYAPARNQKADVVIDVGALAGEFCAYIYDQAKTIYAIEPYSKHYEELTANIEEFELDKIKPFKIALAGSNGQRNLDIQGRGGHVLTGDLGRGEEVEAKTLATFMKEQGIDHVDILKIDVENAEYEIFAAPDFKDVAYEIDFIIGEHIRDLQSLFEKFGFIANNYPENERNVYYKRI